MNYPRPTKSKHYHLVPDNHVCVRCYLGKGVVGFSLSKGKVKYVCNTCEATRAKERLFAKHGEPSKKHKSIDIAIKIKTIKDDINEYFREMY